MKVFGKWELSEVKVTDLTLQKYINLSPRIVHHTHGRGAGKQFGKTEITIIERLINTIMRSSTSKKFAGRLIRGRGACGKKEQCYKIVRDAFDMVHEKTKQNPVQVLVDAIQTAAPREETTRVKYGGVTRHLAVDVSPQRRVDFALRYIGIASVGRSFDGGKSGAQALADELIAAAKNDNASAAIARKIEAERVAEGAR